MELSLSDVIRGYASNKGINSKSINKLLADVGLTGNIKTTLKLVIPDKITLPNEELFNKCKSAITIRNAIVHKGRRIVNHKEIKEFIENIEKLIMFFQTLISHIAL